MHIASTGARQLRHAALVSNKIARVTDRVITRKELSAAARDVEKALGLRPAQRLVLSELVACWGEQEWVKLLVWPSNDHLASRTGLNDRSIRRIIVQLTELGLISAKDSPNGKRYPVRDASGNLIDAYGFDLTPIFARRGEWVAILAEHKATRDARKRAFDEITVSRRATEGALIALAQHLPTFDRSDIERQYKELLSRTPARSRAELPAGVVRAWQELRVVVEEAFYQSGNGGLGVQHIETDNGSPSETCTRAGPRRAATARSYEHSAQYLTPELIIEACPAAADYARPIRTIDDLVAAGRFLRASIGAHESAWSEAVADIGPVAAAVAVIYVLQLCDDDVASGIQRIHNPGGYLRALIRMIKAGKVSLELELRTMRRKRMT